MALMILASKTKLHPDSQQVYSDNGSCVYIRPINVRGLVEDFAQNWDKVQEIFKTNHIAGEVYLGVMELKDLG
jgi:hypothetical protein